MIAAPALAQDAKPAANALTYALKRICHQHLEASGGASLFATEVKSNGWLHASRGGGVTYKKTEDWGRVQVLYSTRGYSGRCMVTVTGNAAAADTGDLRGAVVAFVSERFPKAKHEKDRIAAATNQDVIESVWTDENGRWAVMLGEMATAETKPILRVVVDRAF